MQTTPSKACAVCGKVFEKPSTCSRRDWAIRKCCSRDCGNALKRGRSNPRLGDASRGKKQSAEHVAKRAERIKATYAAGEVRHARANLGLRGEQTTQWKGDDIVYRSAHSRLTRYRGKPTKCEFCGASGRRLEWALKHDAAVVRIEVGGVNDGKRYSPRPDDYIAACCPCHQAYDDRKRDPRTGRYL